MDKLKWSTVLVCGALLVGCGKSEEPAIEVADESQQIQQQVVEDVVPDQAELIEEAAGQQFRCSDGSGDADTVYVRIKNANPGDSVKGSLKCAGLEVATCTATVAAGDTDAECSETSTSNGDGLVKTCDASVEAGNPNASDYSVNCDPPV